MPPEAPGAAFWLDKARRDLRMAELALQQGAVFADQVCFHSQQCAEKALKAMLVAAGRVPPRSHDLGTILDEVERASPAPEWRSLRDAAELLSDFGVGPRYPGWDAIDQSVDPVAVLDAARSVLVEIERQLTSSGAPVRG